MSVFRSKVDFPIKLIEDLCKKNHIISDHHIPNVECLFSHEINLLRMCTQSPSTALMLFAARKSSTKSPKRRDQIVKKGKKKVFNPFHMLFLIASISLRYEHKSSESGKQKSMQLKSQKAMNNLRKVDDNLLSFLTCFKKIRIWKPVW